ncbi:hypothetical protein V8G54_026671 [Vigna mungo]|uniref:Uncharacterized protein n=1 Tax=Vigna mungo TaxID=3915 RepID=A0AAQ3RNE3_VIGMU
MIEFVGIATLLPTKFFMLSLCSMLRSIKFTQPQSLVISSGNINKFNFNFFCRLRDNWNFSVFFIDCKLTYNNVTFFINIREQFSTSCMNIINCQNMGKGKLVDTIMTLIS